MNDTQIGVVYLIIGSLSMVSGFTVIFIYILHKSYKDPPGMLICWHLFSQSFIDTTISVTGFTMVIHQEPIDFLCSSIGAINIYFYFLAFNYIVCLCIEVLIKLQRPMENAYNKRSKAYHLVSHLTSLALALFIYLGGHSGTSYNHFCFIDKSSPLTYFSCFPLLVFFPVLIVTYILVVKMQGTTAYVNFFVKKHLMYITAYFLIWIPVIINILSHERKVLNEISIVLTSSSGFIMTVLRVVSALYIKHLRNSSRSQTNKISIASMINETLKENPEARLLEDEHGTKSDYAAVFSDVSQESALTALIILHYSLLFTTPSRIEAEPPWVPKFYSDRRVIKIERKNLDLIILPQSLGSHCIFYLVSNLTLEYTQYSLEVFKSLMEIEGISGQDLINSFNILNFLSNFRSIFRNSGGRSSSFFLYSFDKKYIIKTISEKELKVLLSDFLQAYHAHLYKNHDSVISRILGAYSFQVNTNYTVHFIVMQSVYNDISLKAVYDLKGSKLNRNVKTEEKKQENSKTVLKDLNFLSQEKNLKMPSSVAQRMKEIIENDVKLFLRFNIMDYSLLVAVKTKQEYSKFFFRSAKCHIQGYSIGIIDYLQTFNKTKKIEGLSKKIMTLSNSSQVSSINSEDYCKRFLNFVFEIVEEAC